MHRSVLVLAALVLLGGCRDDSALLGPDDVIPRGPSAKPLTTWTPLTTGLPSGDVTVVRATTFGLFAGTSDGLVRLSPTGSQWEATDLTGRTIRDILRNVSADVLFALDGGQRLHRSENGSVWTEASVPEAPVGIALDQGGAVIAFGRGAAYRTTDGGETWAAQALQGLRFDGGVTLLTSVVAGGRWLFLASPQGKGLYTSPDGIAWQQIEALGETEVTAAIASSDEVVYVTTADGPVYVSADRGVRWLATRGDGLEDVRGRRTSLATASDGTVYLGTDGLGVFRTRDFGDTWVPFDGDAADASTRVADRVTALETDGQDFLYAGATDRRFFVTATSTTGR